MPVRTPTPDAVVSPLQYAVAENIRRAPACGRATVSVTVVTLASDLESRVWISYSNTNTVATDNVAIAFRQNDSAIRKVFKTFR